MAYLLWMIRDLVRWVWCWSSYSWLRIIDVDLVVITIDLAGVSVSCGCGDSRLVTGHAGDFCFSVELGLHHITHDLVYFYFKDVRLSLIFRRRLDLIFIPASMGSSATPASWSLSAFTKAKYTDTRDLDFHVTQSVISHYLNPEI